MKCVVFKMSIKRKLKSNKLIFRAYTSFADTTARFMGRFFPKYHSKKKYKKIFGRKLDLNCPKTLNEKLMYYKLNLYWNAPIVSKCADKLEVRDFVEQNGCGELLNPLLGAWERAEDIDWNSLPNRFAIKCNHGSGYNLICTDKSSFDTAEAAKILKTWLNETYGYRNAEQGIYSHIKPMIIAEAFIETEDFLPPKDYKFFCSYGEVKLLFVARDRYEGKTKFDYYYPDWTWIPVQNDHPNYGPTNKPADLEKMISYAQKLSKRFPLVRVDFYNANEKIIFGELTFTHFGCIHKFTPDNFDYIFGALFPDVKDANNIKPAD